MASIILSLQPLLLFLFFYIYSITASLLSPSLLTHNCTPPPPPSTPPLQSIKILLDNYLTVKASGTHFATLIIGQEPDRINVLVQCRLDLSLTQCTICVQIAEHTILTLCPNSEAVSAWFDGCYIHYYNHHKFSHAIQVPESVQSNRSHVVDRVQFDLALNTLLLRLQADVSLASHRGFSHGEIVYGNNSSRIYGVAECLRSVSLKDCEVCVGEGIMRLHECCGGKEGGRVVVDAGNCMVRFESYSFFSWRVDSNSGLGMVVSYDEDENDRCVGLKEKVGWALGVGFAILIGVVFGVWLLRRKVVNTAEVGMTNTYGSEEGVMK